MARLRLNRTVPPGSPEPRALTRFAGRSQGAGGCLVLFFGVFFLAGLGFSAFFVLGAWRAGKALTWQETPCTLEESAVVTHDGSDGDTYSIGVRYSYVYDDHEYSSQRYNFLGGSSSGTSSKQEWVDAHPAGSRTVCFVDPKNPAEAVLVRGLSAEYFVVLVPLVFVAVGLGGGVWAFRHWRSEQGHIRSGKAAPGLDVLPALAPPGPITLKSTSPLAKLLGITAIAAFWNGITGVFVWQAVQGWRQGAGDGCLTLFLVPFVLIGLAFLVSVPYQFLALFNPRPRLTLDRGLRLGEAARLDWRFSGLAGRVRRLKLTLTGAEEASYRRGTSTATDRETFAEITLLDTDVPGLIREGTVQVTVPADSMHTLKASNNRIVWKIKLEGEVPGWPDVSEEIEVDVAPGWPDGSGAGFGGGWRP